MDRLIAKFDVARLLTQVVEFVPSLVAVRLVSPPRSTGDRLGF